MKLFLFVLKWYDNQNKLQKEEIFSITTFLNWMQKLSAEGITVAYIKKNATQEQKKVIPQHFTKYPKEQVRVRTQVQKCDTCGKLEFTTHINCKLK